jgi:hypothetical protein
MQPRLRCPRRNVEHDGGLGQRQTDVEVKDEDGALIDGEVPELPIEAFALR